MRIKSEYSDLAGAAVRAYDAIKSWDFINVSQVKPYIKRQQTPFIGLLVSAGIMEEDTKLFD